MATVHYESGDDDRYGDIHVKLRSDQAPTFVIEKDGRYYGYHFCRGAMMPVCLCGAYEALECCCETGGWDELEH